VSEFVTARSDGHTHALQAERDERLTDPSHQDLLQSLRRREMGVAAQISRAFGPMLRGFLTDALDDPNDVDDVMQQTLTDAWRRGANYDPERGSLATWLLLIARSRAVDHLRRRVPEPYDPSSLAEVVDPATENQIDGLIERWRIAGLLAGLPREESKLLKLRFYGGLSQSEIAQRTGIPLGTVKMRMAQGLERLRLAMEDESR
jgi:RNA polymerase sigma-70 factor, ECF subfamily